MHTEKETIHGGEEEEVFSGDVLADDVIDIFDDGDHPIEDDELASTPLETEDDDLFDFFHGDEDERDGMY